MRVGNNPLKRAFLQPPYSNVIACVISHITAKIGYHEKRMECMKTSLLTLRKTLPEGAQILVWDNGSNDEWKVWLYDDFEPDFLHLTPNVGKNNARVAIANMLPPETIIAMADDDILYYPGWFEAEYDIFTTYPNVGVVTGHPIRSHFRWGCENTIAWAREHGNLEIGRFIPEEYEKEFAEGIGRDWKVHVMSTAGESDYRATYKGVQAYCHGHHMQFLTKAGLIAPFCLRSDLAMTPDQPFDISIDNAGLLRLCTTTRYVRHIGNVMDDELRQAADQILGGKKWVSVQNARYS